MGYRNPEAEVYVISGAGIDRNHVHSIRFHSVVDQENYFINKAVHHAQGLSQIRVYGGKIKLQLNPNRAYAYDYLMFRNIPTGNKVESQWIYAFIDSAEYVNDATVIISYTIDWIQTYFVLVSKHTPAAFCLRQHSPKDIIYKNTQPEPVSTGDRYLQKAVPGWSNIGTEALLDNEGNFVNWAPVIVTPSEDISVANIIDGIPTGVNYIPCFSMKSFRETLKEMNEDAKKEVIDIFMYPLYLLNTTAGEHKRYVQRIPLPGRGFNPWKEQYDWTPDNNKLYTYPFCFLTVKGGTESALEYRSELFSGNTMEAEFRIYGTLGNAPQFLCLPIHYDGLINEDERHLDENFQQAVVMNGCPKVPWVTDQYKVWLAQNESSIINMNNKINYSENTRMLRQVVKPLTMDWLNGLKGFSGLNPSSIADMPYNYASETLETQAQIAQLEDARNMSFSTSNYGGSSVYYKCGEYGFRAMYTMCTEEYARRADSYFNVFGYADNHVRRPNFFSRKTYSYFRYAGFNIPQNVRMPDAARSQWAQVMNSGITFWEPTAKIGDYSQSNGVN